jgi:ABC-type Fe3+/spermidine/putrescine transport system ATPase subunit
MDKGEVVQIATPVEMYSAPKTKFVADFIGTSNLFAGTLGTGTISVQGKTLPAPATQLASGSKAVLVLRPEDITLGTIGEISGTLVSSNFYGGSSLLFVDCGFEQLVKVSCALNQVPPAGSTCHLSWSAADSILLADA